MKKEQPAEIILQEEEKLFDLEPTQVLFPRAILYKLAFSPDGKFLASATQNGKLRFFRIFCD